MSYQKTYTDCKQSHKQVAYALLMRFLQLIQHKTLVNIIKNIPTKKNINVITCNTVVILIIKGIFSPEQVFI